MPSIGYQFASANQREGLLDFFSYCTQILQSLLRPTCFGDSSVGMFFVVDAVVRDE